MKLMKLHTGDYDDLILLISNSDDNGYKIGCVVTSDYDRKRGLTSQEIKYPVGAFSKHWRPAFELDQDITLKSKDKLFSNGKSFIIKVEGETALSQNPTEYYTYVSKDNIEIIKKQQISYHVSKRLVIDGIIYEGELFKKVKEINLKKL